MNKLETFDVLIVYTESMAKSASGKYRGKAPFASGSSSEPYNIVYGYFLDMCSKFGLKAALTTSSDIIGAGCCSSFWIYGKKQWHKVNRPGISDLIFDKFSPTKKRIQESRELLFFSNKIRSFNDPELFDLFFDKQITYEELAEYSIPTVPIEDKSVEGIKIACGALSKMMNKAQNREDYGEEIVMKDRFGAGGRRVYKFGPYEYEKMLKKTRRSSKFSYIIQPLVKFDRGFRYNDSFAHTDIRLVYLNGKIVQSYIRRAGPGDFRCNEHQGGSLTYLSLKEIPSNLIERSDLISEKLDSARSLYALDFIISNNDNIYFLEGNTGPGLDWNLSKKRNEEEAKKLIRLIVKQLVTMSGSGFDRKTIPKTEQIYSEQYVF